MKGLYYMRNVLEMMWGNPVDSNIFQNRDELLYAVKTMGKACMGEEDIYDTKMDAYERMRNNIHIHHKFCYLTAEQRQWLSLRKPRGIYSTHANHDIYGLSAIMILQ